MDVGTFRSILPEFGDTSKFPDARIQFYLDLAADSLPRPSGATAWTRRRCIMRRTTLRSPCRA